jgi:multidrug efflux pump
MSPVRMVSLVPLGTIARVENRTVPRSMNRFQQFNAVKLSGVPVRPLDEALAFLEEEAPKFCPRATWSTTPVNRASCAARATNFYRPSCLALVMIFLTLAAQYNSFRDPFVILAGSVPLAMFGALIFTFLKMPDPNVPFWTDSWTTT